jgi:hypothetical protein
MSIGLVGHAFYVSLSRLNSPGLRKNPQLLAGQRGRCWDPLSRGEALALVSSGVVFQ